MAYSQEIIRLARQRLATMKEDRETENRRRLQEAYAKVPKLKQIDLQLRRTMAQAAQAAFLKGDNGQIERVKEENLALQQERKALVESNFPAGFLDETPICHRCGGAGYVGASMCGCLLELCRQEQKKQIAVLAADHEWFENFRLEYYSDRPDGKYGASPRAIMEKVYGVCYRFAHSFGPGSGNLLFSGGTGLGKTFLSACIARVVADRGFSVAYITASRLFSVLERDRFNPDEASRTEVGKLHHCDLLIVDDLGTELPGAFVTAALYSLVNDRLLAGKSMVISTNLTVDEAARRYSPQIASRLQGNFQRLTFVGEDIRVIKNRG